MQQKGDRGQVVTRLVPLVTIAVVLACGGGASAGPATVVGGNAWTWGGLDAGPVAVSVPRGLEFSALAGGAIHVLALDGGGRAWAWGSNAEGQLGTVSTSITPKPVAVTMPAGVRFTAVAAGEHHSLALDSGGRAWAWGRGREGELGRRGTASASAPVAVSMPPGGSFTAIAAGGYHSLAVDGSGRAWAWGRNGEGELGTGSTTDSAVPVPVRMPPGASFVAVAAGTSFSLALDQGGHAWAWGSDDGGELGNGARRGSSSSLPVAVSMPSGVQFGRIAAAGEHAVGLDHDGHAWAWGRTEVTSLGLSNTVTDPTPTAVSTPAGVTLTVISAGAQHSLALDRSGHAWAWGFNENRQLGDGTGKSRAAAVAVHMPAGVVFVAVAGTQCCSLALSRAG